MTKNSLRKASRASASALSAAFVRAFGGGGALGFGVMRRDCDVELSSKGVPVAEREALNSAGVGVRSSAGFVFGFGTKVSSSSSFSSSPNDNLLFASGFFFFFLGGASLRDVEFLPVVIS